MEEDFNKRFFPDSDRDPEEQQHEEALHDANREGWKNGVVDGYIEGYETGLDKGCKESKKIYEKGIDQITVVSVLIIIASCIGCTFLGSWAERKWGRK